MAADLQMTSSNVAASLRGLVARGLVRRSADPDDGRRVRLQTTTRGDGVVDDFRRGQDAWLRRAAASVLSESEQRLLRAAGERRQRLADADAPGAGGGQ